MRTQILVAAYCALGVGCAQSHAFEGYQPTTVKEMAANEEKTHINSLDRTLAAAEVRSAGGEVESEAAEGSARRSWWERGLAAKEYVPPGGHR